MRAYNSGILVGMHRPRVPSKRRGGKTTSRKLLPLRSHVGVAFLFCLAALCSVLLLRPVVSLRKTDETEDDCWVFQHLHKSGGMTIRRIMNPPKGDIQADGDIVGYGSDEWRLGRAFRDGTLAPKLLYERRYRIATGGYTAALRLSPGLAGGCKFFTVFRHPVHRLVSAYYYCRSPKHSWDPLCASSVMDATQADLVAFAEHWGNYAARQMAMAFVPADDVLRYVDEAAGEDRPAMLNGVLVEDIPSWFLLKLYLRHRHQQGGGQSSGGGEKEEGHRFAVAGADLDALNDDAALSELMDSIQDLLRDNFTAIGVVEDFGTSMKLFDAAGVIPGKTWAYTYRKLGAANRNEARETEGGAALRHALVSKEIKKYLRLDLLLYDHAVGVFQNMVYQHTGYN